MKKKKIIKSSRRFLLTALAAFFIQTPSVFAETMGVDISMKDWVVIDAENAEHSSFILDYYDPLHAEYKEDGILSPRSFDGFSGKKASLLCTTKKPDKSYSEQYRFRLDKPIKGGLWVFEQGRMWASPFQWRINDGKWNRKGANVSLEDIRGKARMLNGPTFGWTFLDSLHLQAGEHQLEVQVKNPKDNGLYLLSQDCFVIVPDSKETLDPNYFPHRNGIYLWDHPAPEQDPENDFRPWLKTFLLDSEKPLGAVVVMPGGAYQFRSFTETDAIAHAFNKMGLHAFVLHYRVRPHSDLARLLDAQQAMKIIRSKAQEWKLDPSQVAVCGFSAGGHLAALLSASDDPSPSSLVKPNAVILGYAWRLNEIIPKLSDQFPPAFIWHTGEDTIVPSEESLSFTQSLNAVKRPFELHIYQTGPHGLGIQNEHPSSEWLHSCFLWLKEMDWDFSDAK
jgi:acetyl esterase/lipase